MKAPIIKAKGGLRFRLGNRLIEQVNRKGRVEPHGYYTTKPEMRAALRAFRDFSGLGDIGLRVRVSAYLVFEFTIRKWSDGSMGFGCQNFSPVTVKKLAKWAGVVLK